MSRPSIRERFEPFQALHEGPGALVMPNPWDAGTARLLAGLGFQAPATTSAGLAFALGRRDSALALSRSEVLAHARAIAEATHLPVSADLEDGFGAAPEACAETVHRAAATGLVGGSIEDAMADPAAPIHDLGPAVERVAAAAEACRGEPFPLTARAESFLRGRPDLEDTIPRLRAFQKVGAEVLYAPGLPDLAAMGTVRAAVDRPVSVVMGLTGLRHTVDELAEAGVRRISLGGSLARAALGAMMRAAREVREQGGFGYAAAAIPDREASAAMRDLPLRDEERRR